MKRAFALSAAALLLGAAVAPRTGSAQQAEPTEVAPEGALEPETPSVAPDHVGALSSPDPAVRSAAARALGEAGDPSVAASLATLLETEPAPEVREVALRALAALHAPESEPALRDAARNDPDERIRALAARLAGLPAAAPTEAHRSPGVMDPELPPSAAAGGPPAGRPGRALVISGWVVAGVAYVPCAVAGALFLWWGMWPMIIPAVGPAIFASLEGGWMGPEVTAMAVLASLAQTAGIVLAGIGHHRMRRAALEGRSARPGVQLAFAPGTPGSPAGLTVLGSFH